MKEIQISVIIPALNEEKYIRTALEGLRQQSFKNFEIIVVDGNSKDRTREIARRYAKVVVEKRLRMSFARNAGARHAKGDILLFTDADSKPSKNLLKIYHQIFREKEVVAATGPLVPLEKASEFLSFGFMFDTTTLTNLTIKMGRPAINAPNFAVRHSTFRKCGGFDESLVTFEDFQLSSRLAKHGKIKYSKDAVVATSIRRVAKWGLLRFVMFHVENFLMYNLFQRTHKEYEQVR